MESSVSLWHVRGAWGIDTLGMRRERRVESWSENAPSGRLQVSISILNHHYLVFEVYRTSCGTHRKAYERLPN
jgi:hypothetical protein